MPHAPGPVAIAHDASAQQRRERRETQRREPCAVEKRKRAQHTQHSCHGESIRSRPVSRARAHQLLAGAVLFNPDEYTDAATQPTPHVQIPVVVIAAASHDCAPMA